MQIAFTNSTNTNWDATDSDGNTLNNDAAQQTWHYRNVDLSSYAGRTISAMYLVQESTTSAGAWHIYYSDIALLSADGTVRPIHSRQTSVSLTMSGSSGVSGRAYTVDHAIGLGAQPSYTTAFYHADHLGSSRLMTSGQGYPLWQGTYLPFGEENVLQTLKVLPAFNPMRTIHGSSTWFIASDSTRPSYFVTRHCSGVSSDTASRFLYAFISGGDRRA